MYEGLFSSAILLRYNSKMPPEIQQLAQVFFLRLSSIPMVSPENVWCLRFLS